MLEDPTYAYEIKLNPKEDFFVLPLTITIDVKAMKEESVITSILASSETPVIIYGLLQTQQAGTQYIFDC